MIILSVGLIMTLVMVASAAPTLAQLSPEDKAARKAAKQEQKAAKQQQKAAKQQQKAAKQQQPLPPSGGPPVGTIALYTLGASALVVGGGLVLVGRTVTRR
jgi:type II secretory pathway pseudopilin PulG